MTSTEFNKSLQILSQGIYDIISTLNLTEELTPNNQKNKNFFAPNLNKLTRKELAWLNTDYNAKYDIVTEAFVNLMVAKNPFANFVKKGQPGHKSGVEPWLNLIFQRELSRLSQSQYKKRTKEINESNIFTIDDESASDAFDRLVSKYDDALEKQFSTEEELAFDQLLSHIKKEIDKKANPDVYHLILDMLFIGMSKTEIAKILNVSPARLSKRMKDIKQMIEKTAEGYSKKGDDTLSDMYSKFVKGSTIGNRTVEPLETLFAQLSTAGIDTKGVEL